MGRENGEGNDKGEASSYIVLGNVIMFLVVFRRFHVGYWMWVEVGECVLVGGEVLYGRRFFSDRLWTGNKIESNTRSSSIG